MNAVTSRKSGVLWIGAVAVVLVVGVLAYVGMRDNAIDTAGPSAQFSPRSAVPERWYPPDVLGTGRALYVENCSGCHGAQGQGALDWRRRDPDGKWPPPPLNGTGHAWHHPLPVLYQVIMQGSPAGSGNMPAWVGKLSREEVLAIIAWFQSQWPDELYAAWVRRDEQYRIEADGSG